MALQKALTSETSPNTTSRGKGPASPQITQDLGAFTPHRQTLTDWERLASAAGLRLPQHNARFTTGAMRRWLRRLGVSDTAYKRWDGDKAMGDFITRNPGWLMRHWAGLVLEHREQIQEAAR